MPKVELGQYETDRQERLGLTVELADGSTVTIATPDVWPSETLERLRDPKVSTTADEQARLLLGDEQYERFISDPHGDPRVLDAMIGDWLGGSLGESLASSRKSKGTAKK